MDQQKALAIANKLVSHFETTTRIMHTHSDDALSDVIALRDWVAAQQGVQADVASISEQIDRTVKEIASASGVPADKLSVQRTGGESGQQSLFSAGDVLPAKVTRQSTRR